MPSRSITQSPIKQLTAAAKRLVKGLEAVGKKVETSLTKGLEKAWLLGTVLLKIKAIVGHGNWGLWLEANLPVSARQAQRYMELAAANPTATRVEDLSQESVRKFRLSYVPAKDRAQMDGDTTLPAVCHHLTLVNDFRRWQRRVELGSATIDPIEAKRDLAPLYEWLCGLYGVKPANLSGLLAQS